ncbi:MAG: DUF7305 domain-containing protein [Fimbriimonadales bacterium]
MRTATLNSNRRLRGGVLVTVLVFAAILSLFLAGVARLAVAHYSRANVEADNAAAIQLADAGINFELRWVSDDPRDPNRAHQAQHAEGQNGAYTGTVEGVPGSYVVSVRNDSVAGPWYAPAPMAIQSTGTVNGISRTVEIKGEKHSIFDEYAVYALQTGTLNGNQTVVIGNYGTNGVLTINGTGTLAVNGEVWFNGIGAGANVGRNVFTTPMPVEWPTIDEIANDRFAGGLTWLSTNNNNNTILQFSKNRPLDPNFTIANAIWAGFTQATHNHSAQIYKFLTKDDNPNDNVGGSRYATPEEGIGGHKVAIIPPGDYYLTDLDMSNTSSGPAWLIDNAAGNVNIWISGGGTDKDSLDMPVHFTSKDPSKFRLYYNKCSELSIQGNSTFYGSVYAVPDGCAATIKIGGNSTINGSVIAVEVLVTGNSVVNFPNNGSGSGEGDWILWYGFRNNWREVNPSGGVVFPDGTSK